MADLKIHITFAAGVTNAAAAFATQKYNKKGVYCFQFDDGSPGMLVADADIWNTRTYTDGCGNARKVTGSVGMNQGTGVPGSNGYKPAVLQGPALKALIANNHDIENHSFTHEGISYAGMAAAGYTADQMKGVADIALLSAINEDDTINTYAQYKPRCFIVPTDFAYFDTAAQSLGYISCISQNAAVFVPGGSNDAINGAQYPIVGILPDALGQTPDFYRMLRDYNDDWGSTHANDAEIMAQMDKLLSGEINFYILFTHSTLDTPNVVTSFSNILDYLVTRANDNILMCSVREALEYRIMRRCAVTQTLTGNILTINVNTDNLGTRHRWMDCCFNITADAAITNVAAEGFDSTAYNPATGLVNAFLQKTVWGAASTTPARIAPVPDADQSLIIKRGKFTTS